MAIILRIQIHHRMCDFIYTCDEIYNCCKYSDSSKIHNLAIRLRIKHRMFLFHMDILKSADCSDGVDKIHSPWITLHMFWLYPKEREPCLLSGVPNSTFRFGLDMQVVKITLCTGRIRLHIFNTCISSPNLCGMIQGERIAEMDIPTYVYVYGWRQADNQRQTEKSWCR